MQTGRTEKIGNVVLDYSHYPEQDFYCDGASEDALLELVKATRPGNIPRKSIKRRAGRCFITFPTCGKISSDGCLLTKA